MKAKVLSRRLTAGLIASTALLIAGLGAVPSAGAATIYACQKKKGGTIHIVTKKAKCKKGETKLSWNSQGVPGKNGANGTNGAPGKEGAAGKNGNNGLNGTALAYAEVSSSGTLTQSKGVTGMTPGESPGTGVYCLDIPGTLHIGVATSDSLGGGAVPSLDSVDMAPIFEIIFEECAVGTTVAVHTYNFKAEAADAGFFLDVN